jgi:hypothetical protein
LSSVVVQHFMAFEAAVVGRVVHDKVGVFSVFKYQRHILKEGGLIGFCCKVGVGVAVIN